MPLHRLRKMTLARPAVLLALAFFAPLAIYAAVNTYLALDRRRTAMTAQSIAGVQALLENVDRQLATGLEDAETLAVAPALDPSEGRPANLTIFQEVARRTQDRHPDWQAVVLRAPDGRWLYSTQKSDESARRELADRLSFEEAVRTGQPQVGTVVRRANGRWAIPLRAPVVRDGRVAYVVTVALDPAAVLQTLSTLRMSGPWVTFVADAQGRVVAHLPDDSGRWLGVPVAGQERAARERGGGGSYPGRTPTGADSESFYWSSATTGWSAHAVVPRAAWEAPLRQTLAAVLASFFACLALAAALVVLWLRDSEARRRQTAAVELATRIDALGRLTGGVAHDFNNLLTVIQGNTEILGRRVTGLAPAERPLAAIRAAADRASRLTRQLLVFARGGPAEPVAVDLERKILDLQGALSQIAGPGVDIETQLESDLPPVRVDPLQLEAALLNLAANARDAMDGGGTVHVKLRRHGSWIALTVRDEGPGFEAAALPRVFDPFFTTKPVGQGTGLGLSQVYGLVKGAGGRVEAANAPGGGAVVTLFFPPSDDPLEAEAETERLAAPAGPPAASSPACILLVDDNEAVRATTALYLRDGGLAVLEAVDAAAALRLLRSTRVQAMITDIVMPGEMDGMSLAEAARAARPGLPVLLVSGYSERAVEAQQRGFLVISKPYGLPELERRLRLLVEAPLPAGV